MKELNAKQTYSRFGLTYALGQLGYSMLTLLISFLLTKFRPGFFHSLTGNLVITYVLLVFVAYPAMYFAIRNLKKTEIPKKNLSPGMFFACLPIAYALATAANSVGLIINSRLGEVTGNGAVNPVLDLMTGVSPVILVIVAVILAPVCEELTFRKFLIDRTVGFGEKTAMVMSGLIFGLYHGNLAQFAYAFVLGMFFAFIYIRTGKIIYTILLHVFINGTSTLLSQLILRRIDIQAIASYLESGDMDGYMAYCNAHMADILSCFGLILMVFAFILLGIILIIVFHKKFVLNPVEGELEKGNIFNNVIVNVGMIVFLIYCVGNMIIAQCGLERNIARLIMRLFS